MRAGVFCDLWTKPNSLQDKTKILQGGHRKVEGVAKILCEVTLSQKSLCLEVIITQWNLNIQT